VGYHIFTTSSINDDIYRPSPILNNVPERLCRPDLQVYTRRPKVDSSDLATSPIGHLSPNSSHQISPSPPPDLDVPIAFRKGKRSCTLHPISNFVSYDHLSPSYLSFVATLSSIPLHKSVTEALSHSGWKRAMEEEMLALKQNDTWDLVSLPPGKSVVGGCMLLRFILMVLLID
jgi:hypothetical protein